MPRSNNKMVKAELAENAGEAELRRWEVKDLVPLLMDQKDKLKKQAGKITRLEEVISEHTDPGDRLVSGLAETGVSAVGGFLSPFVIAMLGEDWQQLTITDDFGIDSEAIFAGGLYGLGLILFWRDLFYGKWFFEAGKGAVASYAGHIGRNLGAQIALPAAA
jgi:hypothetical protein